MKFEFEYNLVERKSLDRLNNRHAVGPGRFGLLWCACFVPTAVCLMWLNMWTVVIAGLVLVLMASFVPAIFRLRGAAAHEFPRSIELSPVGKREICGDTTAFVKWNSMDEFIEREKDFLFTRNERYSLLPKRVIATEQIPELRDRVAQWRNYPEASTEPIQMFSQLLDDDGSQNWEFELRREDLVQAAQSSSIRPVFDEKFSFKDIQASRRSRRWMTILAFGLLLKLALILIVSSLPPNRMEMGPIILFLCLNPFVLLLAMGFGIRRRGIRGVPRFSNETYRVRLFDGGWVIGNEDLAAFNKWNERSIFYLAKEFIGIRTDLALIHVMPIRGFGGVDGVWQFLDRAIRLKRNWLHQKSGNVVHTQISEDVDNEHYAAEPVNPYRSPSVNVQ